jgi:hypothetical protein
LFQWGTSTTYGNTTASVDLGNGLSAQSIPGGVSISGLAPSTIYHFRVEAYNRGGASYGSDVAFTTAEQPAPSVQTLPATSITTSTAVLNANVNPNNAGTTVYFEYGPSANYGQTTGQVVLTGGEQSYSATLTGLSQITPYHFRVVASNSGGTSYGQDIEFVTGGVH